MATVAGRNLCITCGKNRATLKCGGCLQEFCFNHLADHRQELSKQLDKIEVSRDLFRQTLTEQTTDQQKHALIQQIDDWERDSIKSIQKTAEEAREKLLKHITEQIEKLEIELNTLTKQLQQSREENDFYETDLNHWNEELTRLTKELSKPPNINLRQISTPLIYKLCVDTTSEQPTVLKSSSSSDSGASEDFKNFSDNNNDKNINPNRSNDGFSARGRLGGFGGNSGGFGSNNDGDSRACCNCNQTGHMSRECSNPRKENRNGGGGSVRSGFNSGDSCGGFTSGSGFNSGSGDRNINFGSGANGVNSLMSMKVHSSRNQNDNDQEGIGTRILGIGRGRVVASNGNDGENSNGRSTFNSFTSRGGFNGSGGGGFRGGRGGAGGGGFNSDDHDNRGSGGSGWQNRTGNQSRDFPGERRPPACDGNGFFSVGRKDQTSDDIFGQPGGRAGGARPTERYIPPRPPTTEDDIFGKAVSKGENFGKYHRTQVQCTPADKVKPIELYEDANLGTQILSNIRRAHFEEPTPIQRYTIPCIRQQDDIMACAQTGSGKTAAFLLPIISNLLEYHADELSEKLHRPSPLCLIVSPTRELALQIEREARKFTYQTAVIPCSAVGGHDMFTVSDRLREGCHILLATTDRLKDMVKKSQVSLKKVKYFVLDEADRMLDTGFEPDIRKLEDLGLPPKDERFTFMFSATFPDEIQKLARPFLRENYIFLAVGTPGGANEDIAQTIEEVPQANKKDRLLQLLEQNRRSERCLIFAETKRSVDYIGALLSQKKLLSTTMHGDRTQKQLYEAVQQFTNGKCPILVATSVAALGLDFPLISYVVNYDLPDAIDFYIRRIGRTGRAGHLGKSISFFDPDRDSDRKIAPELIAKLTEAGQEVPEFLEKFADGANVGFNCSGFGSRNADMRSGVITSGARSHHTSVFSDGTTSDAAIFVDEWD